MIAGIAGLLVVLAAVAAHPGAPRRERWAATGLAAAGTIVVLMTGSRAALAGLVVIYLAIIVIRTRRVIWAWKGALAAVVVGLFVSGQTSRLDIWSSALRGIED